MRALLWNALIVIGWIIAAMVPAAAAAETLVGTATFEERGTLPPEAVFEAILEEVSRADAPATEIGRTHIEVPRQSPIAFSIAYDPAAIDKRLTYVVRTRIVDGERLLFTSDTAHRVLTKNAPDDLVVVMKKVDSSVANPSPASASAENPESADRRSLKTGMFVYMADAARFTDCRTDSSLPVTMEGDYRRLEKAYLEARPGPGQPLMVTFEGHNANRPRMEGDGTEPSAIVTRFVRAWPGETCERNRAEASLTNTYWRIVRLGEDDVRTSEGQREPHLLLRADEMRYAATVGCNQLIGGYKLDGASLQFLQGLSTMMACPPPLDYLERALAQILADTRRWEITAQFLELRSKGGSPLALLQAVYLH